MSLSSKYSFDELVKISMFDVNQLASFVRGMSYDKALQFRNDIQRGIADVAKKSDTMPIQENLVGMTTKIEKWCRMRFVKDITRKLVLGNFECARNKKYAKMLALQEWEKVLRGYSY